LFYNGIILQVAAGEPLPVTQEQLELRGHSLEARIYAEDPEADFLPGAGPLIRLSMPAVRSDVRVETGNWTNNIFFLVVRKRFILMKSKDYSKEN
jgi:acetyl/propionyl-CoA carboxylase alpha subunit